jgi:hypothetical protein
MPDVAGVSSDLKQADVVMGRKMLCLRDWRTSSLLVQTGGLGSESRTKTVRVRRRARWG